MSNSKPSAFSNRPACCACCTPSGVSSTSVQPVKRFERFQVDSPWRISTSLCMAERSSGGLKPADAGLEPGAYGRRPGWKSANSIIAIHLHPHRLPVKFIIDNWFLFLAAVVSGGLLIWPLINKSAGGASKVSPADAVQLINRERAVLIDVSEPAEFAAGHVVGSRSVPLAMLAASKDLPKNKALPLIVVCATGARAGRAAATLKAWASTTPARWPAGCRPGVQPICRLKKPPDEPTFLQVIDNADSAARSAPRRSRPCNP